MARTRLQQKALVEYVTQVQHALGLDHWDIRVTDEEPESKGEGETVLGMTHVEHFGYRATMLYRTDTVFGEDREETRRVVVHELVHLYIEHWALDIDEVVRPLLSSAHASVLERAYERAVESITGVMIRLVPLPVPDLGVVS